MFDLPRWMPSLLFALSASAIGLIFVISLIAVLSRDFQFFPPPSKVSWQHRTFLILFRLYLYPLIGLSILFFEPVGAENVMVHYGIGSLLLVTGFGLAFWITFRMGWRNAFGEKLGLKTEGWFSISRNPVYVATWIGLVGWTLVANNVLVTVLLLLWAVMYLFAPFVEEPWLEREYGDEYRAYRRRTRRFL